MTDGELLCNFKKCRKILSGTAYITRCSHAFCEEDGIKQIESQHFDKKCPACQSPLVKNYDLVKVTLNPNDQFKSMVLAGLRPEVVMDIATRAIMFWSYQQHQEQMHQSLVSKNLKDVINQIKTESEVESGVLKTEIQTFKRKQEELEKDLGKITKKCNELAEKLSLKTREVQKWQMMCESLRRKQLTEMVMQRDVTSLEGNPTAVNVGPQTMDEFLPGRVKMSQTEHRRIAAAFPEEGPQGRQRTSQQMKDDCFVFQPRAVNCASPKVFLENGGIYRSHVQRKY